MESVIKKPANHTNAPKKSKYPPKEPEGFQLTHGSSMKIVFPNGYSVLICFGISHWCSNRFVELRDLAEMHEKDAAAAALGAQTGAVYTFEPTHRRDAVKVNLDTLDDATHCHKFQTTLQYLDILNKVSILPSLECF